MLLLVLDAVDQCNNVMVKLQLSVDGHPEFCFITRNERSQLSLIKVKKVYMYTNLCTETSTMAEVL